MAMAENIHEARLGMREEEREEEAGLKQKPAAKEIALNIVDVYKRQEPRGSLPVSRECGAEEATGVSRSVSPELPHWMYCGIRWKLLMKKY